MSCYPFLDALYPSFCYIQEIFIFFNTIFVLLHALKDLNPRHQVLETCVLPTELKALIYKLYITFYV